MADTLLPFFGHVTEFYQDPLTGQTWNGTCTQTSFEVCFASLEGHWPSEQRMACWSRDMVANKLSQPNGASTVAAMARYARAMNVKTPTEWDFGTPFSDAWHQLLLDNAGIHPILLQIANGQALVDAETGSRDESGLHYHAIAIGGKQVNGYICADGDNPEAITRHQVYTWDTLVAAQPCGLILMSW